MRRRDFLGESGRAALGLSLVSLAGCSHRHQRSAELKDGAPWGTLIADFEKEIPKLMGEGNVPGLSIVMIQDAKLVWRRGFGVRESASQTPVDNDTVFQAQSIWRERMIVMEHR